MAAGIDLDAYLQRIEWGGSTRPVFDTLAGVLDAHMSRIPFENLDVLLGRAIRLDLEGLQNKLVRTRRGGYCFEHATLFAAVIGRLGFRPTCHSARVLTVNTRNASPRTHMFLTVSLDHGTFVVDPGFGALAPRVPVPLFDGATAHSGSETHSMARDGQCWVLRAQTGAKIVDAWVSTLEHDYPADFEMGNHFTATYPGSPFVNHIMMRALAPDAAVKVMDRDVTISRAGESRSTQLADRRALRELLTAHFGFDLPEVERLRVPAIPEWE